MIAKKVYENMRFERGIEPKHALGLGEASRIVDNLKAAKEEYDLFGKPGPADKFGEFVLRFIRFIGYGNSYRKWLLKSEGNKIIQKYGLKKYIEFPGFTHREWAGEVYYKIKPEYHDLFRGVLNLQRNTVYENMGFERGMDPSKSLEIGTHRKIRRPFDWKDIPIGNYKAVWVVDGEPEVTHIEWDGHKIKMLTDWYPVDGTDLSRKLIYTPEQFNSNFKYNYIKRED